MTRAMAGRCRYGSFQRNCFAAVDARRNKQTMPRGDEMPKKDASLKLNRRRFLTAAAVAGASGAVSPAKAATAAEPPQRLPSALPPNAHVAAAETGAAPCPSRDNVTPGSNFMVDVIKTLDIKYLPANPASSYRGIHESLINYGKNTMPEFLTCTHEESGVAMCHGYFKATGKPIMTLVHGTVGLQHASMAIYNAWCDRVPVYLMIGNILEADKRAPVAVWVHSGIDPSAMVLDFVKWDDQPASLQHFAESAVRAYKIAVTAPMAPVLLSLDAELQENPIQDSESLRIPKLARVVPPQADSGALAETAKLL